MYATMELSTLILGGIALYLITDTKKANKQLQSQIDSVTTSFSDYKQDQEIKEELADIEREAAAADADIASKCYPTGFFGIIGNYYTSDKYISAAWFVKFKNVSNDEITVNLESLSVTILHSKQIRHQSDLLRKKITVSPKSETSWIQVANYRDDILYGYSTVGADIQSMFPDNRYNYWYSAAATFKYSLSNPYVNSGLSVDVKDYTIYSGVYGIRIYNLDGSYLYSVFSSSFLQECAKWVDYQDALDDYYWKKTQEALGVEKPEQIQAALDASYENRKKFIQIFQTEPPIEKPVIMGIETNTYSNQLA